MAIKVFISYVSSDRKKKNTLKKLLNKTEGMEAIVVEDYSINNIDFIDKVKKDIDRADYFIPILTQNSYQKSQWVNQEIGYAEAKLGRERICVLVQRGILSKLKGFYNDKKELPYNFRSSKDEKKENTDFLKIVKRLISDIQEENDLAKTTGLYFKSILRKSNSNFDVSLNLSITDLLKIHFRIEKNNIDQIFKCYYEIESITGKTYWIGYTDDDLLVNRPYKTVKEFTKHIGQKKALKYEFSDQVKKIFVDRWSAKGEPKILKTIRFRGDKFLHEPIKYLYAIENK